MSSANCCNKDPSVVSKIEFLEAKAMNFKKYLETMSPDAEVRSYIDSFRPELLAQTITTVVVPIVTLGQIDYSVDELMNHLTIPEGGKPEVKRKLAAYIQMFHDVLMDST